MTDPKADLIAKYLAGESDDDDVQQLDRLLTDNARAADALMSEAYMDVHLREVLSGSALGAAIAHQLQPTNPVCRRFLSTRWMAAAMLLVAISGWAVAAYVFDQLGEARNNISALKSRVSELEKASTKPPVAKVEPDAPEIHSLRGWLMALPQQGDPDTEGETLLVGTAAPLGQTLWTCPWGAAEFRYDSGVSISVERNTTVKLDETDDLRQLTLERGIVHVTNLSKTDKRPTEIKCALATVRLIRGQVAVQVDKQQMAVEGAVHRVEVLVEQEGVQRKFIVRRGQYLIIKPGQKPKVVRGMLKLGLEPPNR